MDGEEKEIIEKTLELTEENNKILRSMKRSMLWGRIFKSIYWIIIIGVAIGAYYYIEPYTDGLLGTYKSIKENIKYFENRLAQ